MGRIAKDFGKRILFLLLSLATLVWMTFTLVRIFPGSPLLASDETIDPLIQDQLRHYFLLDQSYAVQFGNYLSNLLHGDLGVSMHYMGKSVNSLILEHAKVSIELGIIAFSIAILGSLAYAVISRVYRISHFTDKLVLFFYSIPVLALAPFCIWLFSFRLNLLPVALLEYKSSYIMPLFLLSLKPTCSLARVLSEELDRVLSEAFIELAEIQGYSRAQIVLKWALKNSWTAYLVQVAPIFAGLISGSFIVEMVFALPGLGSHFLESVLNRDWPLIMGLTIFYGAAILISHFILDLLAHWIDPRLET